MDIILVFSVAAGAALGSFLALVFDRLRKRESVIAPGSRCAACKTPVRPLDNVPIVSWALLRGRCRYCKAFIPLHVLLFEVAGAVTGIVFALHVFRS